MKEIKQKPAGGKPKTADAARVPKAVVKAAWLQAREAARAGEKQVVGGKDGAYSGAADTGEKGADKLVSTGERVTELAYRGGRKLAERSAGQRRERAKAAQTGGEAAQRHGAGETIAHTSTIEASRPPQTREAGRVSDENRPAGARPQQRESRAVGRAKPIKPGREMKQGAPGPKTTEQAGKARQAVQAAARNGQAKARFTQRAQQTAKRAVDTTKRATDAARAGMRALVEALHSLLIALAAGGSVAVLIVVLICLIAFVAGSAYGIFFAAEAPGEDAFTVQQAVEQLGGEYRDYLQQIESTMPHDRQEIKANDDVYYIRWQDVLAVFSSYVSGAEDGAPVAYLDESRLQQLRQTMWDMNEVAYSTYTETVEIEADEPAGDENTDSGDSSKNPGEDTESGNGTESAAAKTVTQTVLLIELTHKTPDEMAQDYAYTARQQEYLDLLRAPEYETLWAELLGGFLSGGGEYSGPCRCLAKHRPAAVAAADYGQHYLAVRLPHRSHHRRGQLPQRHRHCCPRRHAHPGRRRWYRHSRQRRGQLGRQLWLLRQARPRRRPANPLRPLPNHLRHRRPAGAGRAGHWLRRAHRAGHRGSLAF